MSWWSVSLGLAIGACTAAFSLIDALVLRQLPVRDPHRLVYVSHAAAGGDDLRVKVPFSYPFFERVRQTTSPRMEAFNLSFQSLRQAVLPDAGGVEEKLQTQFVLATPSGRSASQLHSDACWVPPTM
jgi:putative ABC transport system permease protein